MIKSLLPTPRQPIHIHSLYPFFTCVTARIPPRDHAFVMISFVVEQRSNPELHMPRLRRPSNHRSPQSVDLVHALHELQQALALRKIIKHWNHVLFKQRHIPGCVGLEVLEKVGEVLATSCRSLVRCATLVAWLKQQHCPNSRVESAVHVRVSIEPYCTDTVHARLGCANGPH